MKVQISAKNRAYHFNAAPGERILFAGLGSGIRLPYECGSGTCGTCKARLLAGDIEDQWPEAPGRKYLRHPGELLMCQALARSDCRLEVANFVYNMDAGACVPRPYRGMVHNPRLLTHDVLAFSVELPEALDFDAGQFMAVRVPGVSGYRGYSMVNFERGAKQLDFVVKKKPGGGVSQWLFNGGIEGESVELFGPLGSATFFPGIAKNVLCVAGGSGIAGMMSILERGAQERYFERHDGWVFFGVRTMRDAFFLEELSEYRRRFPERLRVTVALSDEAVPESAERTWAHLCFARGLVHEVARRAMAGEYRNVRAYVAGPPPAVDAAIRVLLLEAKLGADNIRYDKFS